MANFYRIFSFVTNLSAVHNLEENIYLHLVSLGTAVMVAWFFEQKTPLNLLFYEAVSLL